MTLRTLRISALASLALVAFAFLTSCAGQHSLRDTRSMVEITGVIRSRDGKGLPNVQVVFWPGESLRPPDGPIRITDITDRQGRYGVRVTPGRYRSWLHGLLTVPNVYPDTTIWAGQPVNRFDYQYGGIRVRGRVVGFRHQQVSSGLIEAMGGATSRLSHGSYEIFLARGKYTFLSKNLPGGLPDFEIPGIDVHVDTTIDFTATGELVSGRVLLGNKLAVGAMVEAGGGPAGLTWPYGPTYRNHSSVDHEGRFRMYLPRGKYHFHVLPGRSQANVPDQYLVKSVSGPGTLDLVSEVEWDRARDSLQVEIALDDSQYVMGQPILALIKVRNVGSTPFRDLGPIQPGMGGLSLTLEEGSTPTRWAWGRYKKGSRSTEVDFIDYAFSSEGILLAPGKALCEVVDLLDGFGPIDSMTLGDSNKVNERWLDPGKYTLRAALTARTGIVKSLPQIHVGGESGSFEVTAAPLDLTKHTYDAFSYTLAPKGKVSNVPERKEALKRSLDSRSFYYLWRRSWLPESDFPVGDMMKLLETHGRNPVLIAAVVNHRCKYLSLPDTAKLEWIRELRSATTNVDAASVLESWQTKIEQDRYYAR